MRVRRFGRSYAHPLLVLVACLGAPSSLRIGIIAGRSVGKAVQRNRAKRRIRACLGLLLNQISTGWDLVFIARQSLSQAGFEQICEAVKFLLVQAALLERMVPADTQAAQ